LLQDHIAEQAVGTLELQDKSVTSAKLADRSVLSTKLVDRSVTSQALDTGAVTYEKLSSNLVTRLSDEVLHAVGSTSGALLGQVSSSGVALRPGYSATRISTGEYRITFDEHFKTHPVVVVSAEAYATCYCPTSQVTTQTVVVHCMSALLTSMPNFFDTAFSFYAAATVA